MRHRLNPLRSLAFLNFERPLEPLACCPEFQLFPARCHLNSRNELRSYGIESGGVSRRRRHGSSSLRRRSTPGAGATLGELRTPTSPSIVPSEAGHDTYLVLDGLGRLGRVWRETRGHHDALIRELLDDQYSRPTRIVAFNTAEGWSAT